MLGLGCIVLIEKIFCYLYIRYYYYQLFELSSLRSHFQKTSQVKVFFLIDIIAATLIGEYYGSKGSLLKVQSGTGSMYIKFTTDGYYASSGFKATVKKGGLMKKK